MSPWDDVDATHLSREWERRESFGSIFPGSSGTRGNGNGDNISCGQPQTSQRSTTFNIDIKPKEPPIFYGRASEDIDTWLAKVGISYTSPKQMTGSRWPIWLRFCKKLPQIGGQHY